MLLEISSANNRCSIASCVLRYFISMQWKCINRKRMTSKCMLRNDLFSFSYSTLRLQFWLFFIIFFSFFLPLFGPLNILFYSVHTSFVCYNCYSRANKPNLYNVVCSTVLTKCLNSISDFMVNQIKHNFFLLL